MDEVLKKKEAKGPILLPPPKEITYGSETMLITPASLHFEASNEEGSEHVTKLVSYFRDQFFPNAASYPEENPLKLTEVPLKINLKD